MLLLLVTFKQYFLHYHVSVILIFKFPTYRYLFCETAFKSKLLFFAEPLIKVVLLFVCDFFKTFIDEKF